MADAKEEKMADSVDKILLTSLATSEEKWRSAGIIPAQATREQLEAALRKIIDGNKLPECKHYLADAVLRDGCHYSRDIRVATAIAEAERLLGGK